MNFGFSKENTLSNRHQATLKGCSKKAVWFTLSDGTVVPASYKVVEKSGFKKSLLKGFQATISLEGDLGNQRVTWIHILGFQKGSTPPASKPSVSEGGLVVGKLYSSKAEEGCSHFMVISRLGPDSRFVQVYGWESIRVADSDVPPDILNNLDVDGDQLFIIQTWNQRDGKVTSLYGPELEQKAA